MSALTLGLIAAVCWGFHDICVRFLSQTIPLMASLLVVLIAGLGFHLGLMVWADGFAPMSTDAMIFAIAAGVAFLVASMGLYFAFQRGPVRLVAPAIASYPILSVSWAALNGTTITPWQWVAVIGIIIGVSIVAALSDDGEEDVPAKGLTILYALIAAVGFASTFALGQHAAELSGDMPATLVTRITALLTLAVVIAAWRLPFWPGRNALPMLGLMGVADGVALYCVVSAGGLPDAQYAAVTASMFGLLTIVMAWAVLRERMTLPQWGGCCLAFAGVGYLAL